MSTAEKVEQLFTWASFTSLQGAVAATLVFTNVIGSLVGAPFNSARKYVAFLFAVVLEIALAAYAHGPDDLQKWFVALMNGFLVYASAVGINEGATALKVRALGLSDAGSHLFFRRWLPG